MCLIYTINYLHIHVYSCMHACSFLNMFLHIKISKYRSALHIYIYLFTIHKDVYVVKMDKQ